MWHFSSTTAHSWILVVPCHLQSVLIVTFPLVWWELVSLILNIVMFRWIIESKLLVESVLRAHRSVQHLPSRNHFLFRKYCYFVFTQPAYKQKSIISLWQVSFQITKKKFLFWFLIVETNSAGSTAGLLREAMLFDFVLCSVLITASVEASK